MEKLISQPGNLTLHPGSLTCLAISNRRKMRIDQVLAGFQILLILKQLIVVFVPAHNLQQGSLKG
jgi:hypothetical protein